MQLIGKVTTQVLECLQEDLTTFYKSKEGKEYVIQDAYPGQVCMCVCVCVHFNVTQKEPLSVHCLFILKDRPFILFSSVSVLLCFVQQRWVLVPG